jgi:hypothetical protein
MKKLSFLLTAFAFVALTTSSAFAQPTIAASAEVQSNLVASQEQDLNFGVVPPDFTDGDPTIDPIDGSNTNIDNATSLAVGFVNVSGTQGQGVNVFTDNSVILDGPGSASDVITLTPTYNYTFDNPGSSGNAEGSANIAAPNTLDMTLDADGINTILIGGSLSEVKSDALATGTYDGTVTVTVSYQ